MAMERHRRALRRRLSGEPASMRSPGIQANSMHVLPSRLAVNSEIRAGHYRLTLQPMARPSRVHGEPLSETVISERR